MNAEAGQHSATEVILGFCTRCTRSTLSQSHGFPCTAELFSVFCKKKAQKLLENRDHETAQAPKSNFHKTLQVAWIQAHGTHRMPSCITPKAQAPWAGLCQAASVPRVPVSPSDAGVPRVPVAPQQALGLVQDARGAKNPLPPKSTRRSSSTRSCPVLEGVTRGRICSANRAPGGRSREPPEPPTSPASYLSCSPAIITSAL